jgi:hypothetical protein
MSLACLGAPATHTMAHPAQTTLALARDRDLGAEILHRSSERM